MPITQEQHIKNSGSECPCCGSGDIEGKSFDHYGGHVTQEVSCNSCHAVWEDYFILAHYGLIDSGDGPC